MQVVVLTKYVPSPSGLPPEIGPGFRLTRAESDGGLDASDEPGLEVAAQAAAKLGATVTALSLGPERGLRALRRALALGADDAVLISDTRLEGADVLATVTALARALERRPFDLVLAGVESTDGATGTLPVALAERLGIASATFARRVIVSDGRVSIERQTESGYDVVECGLPAVVSVTAAAGVARHPSLRDTIAAKKKPIEQLSLDDLGLGADDVRPTQWVRAIDIAPEKEPGEIVEDAALAAARVVELLREEHVI